MSRNRRRLIILLAALGGAALIGVAVQRLFGMEWAMLVIGVFGLLVAADMIIDENRNGS